MIDFTGLAQYNWAGMRTSLSYGPDETPEFNESRTYSNLLQLSRLTTLGDSTVLDMEYIYQAGQNNGRIVQSIDGVLNETVNYTYDSLNRLMSAEEASGKWGNAFSYDGWGNLNGQTWTPGQAATPGTVAQLTRDANGNYTGAGLYDVENRLIPAPPINDADADGSTRGYDPWNKRVAHTGGLGENVNQYFFYGVGGQRLATYQITVNNNQTYTVQTMGTNVYFGGTLIVSNGVPVATDRTGSVRANANREKMAYYPYGLERGLPPSNTSTKSAPLEFAGGR